MASSWRRSRSSRRGSGRRSFTIDQAMEKLEARHGRATEADGRAESLARRGDESAITDFVARVTEEGGSDYVEPAARVAVFDNDGTLWSEKPLVIQLDFTIQQLGRAGRRGPDAARPAALPGGLRGRPALDGRRDGQALPAATTATSDLLMGAVTSAFETVDVEDYDGQVLGFSRTPRTRRSAAVPRCGYAPMVELLRYLEDNGFTTYIASGGDRTSCARSPATCTASRRTGHRQCARPRVPRRRRHADVALQGGHGLLRRRPGEAGPGSGAGSGDGRSCRSATPTATCRCWPTPAARARRRLRLLLLHDDDEREFDYTAGAEKALDSAAEQGWTVVSMKNDWTQVFPSAT